MKRLVRRFDKPGEYEEIILCQHAGEEKEGKMVIHAKERAEYKLRVTLKHAARETKGRVVVRAVVENGAKVVMEGTVKIGSLAQGVDSFLELRALVLDEKSTVTIDPQLEIEANEVRAGHAASVTRIDEEQCQYLMSRGIAKGQAKMMMIKGFLGGE